MKFINSLRETGIAVQRATADLTVSGRRYPQGSFVVETTVGGTTYPAGSFYVKAKNTTRAQLDEIAADLGLDFTGTTAGVPDGASVMRTPRVGLLDQYGGSMPSWWTRWILEQFHFPFERVYAPQLDTGNLNARYDVLIFVSGAIPGAGGGRGARAGGGGAVDLSTIPAEYRSQYRAMTVEKTLPAIRTFVENGGKFLFNGIYYELMRGPLME